MLGDESAPGMPFGAGSRRSDQGSDQRVVVRGIELQMRFGIGEADGFRRGRGEELERHGNTFHLPLAGRSK